MTSPDREPDMLDEYDFGRGERGKYSGRFASTGEMMSVETLMPAVERLSVADRLELIERIWDSLPESLEPIELSDFNLAEIARRRAEAEKNPGRGRPWRHRRVRDR